MKKEILRTNVLRMTGITPVAKKTVKYLVTSKRAAFTLAEVFSPHCAGRRKIAFTLAEVLITLGIIGIVAAMTMPTLIYKYQMKTFEVAFKKQYSVLNNTIDYLMLENGLSECYLTIISYPVPGNPNNRIYSSNNSDCSALRDGIIEKLKLTPIKNDFSYNTNFAEILANGGTAVNRNTGGVLSNTPRFSAYLLPDGAIVMFRPDGSSFLRVCVVVDVNGKKGPNKWGYDVFWLALANRNGKVRLSDEYISFAEKGGRLPRAILTDGVANGSGRVW